MSLRILCLLALIMAAPVPAAEPFMLRDGAGAVPLVLGPDPARPIETAAGIVAGDIGTVVGDTPELRAGAGTESSRFILVGELGRHPLIDGLVERGLLELEGLAGEWESFIRQVIEKPWPGVDSVLVIAGSDPRGTVYGLFSISEAIGVSPWVWWADVPAARDRDAAVPGERHRSGPPSVKYRGIFLNDEDWALHPWAAKIFDPEYGDIGPKTYAKVFELLLRLRANTLWPAMHATTQAFNLDPENARLAARYGIVMGTSHAEPMLRNNVGEWTAPHEDYDYTTNREGVLEYWRERLRTNSGYENIYTLGMRGIHDSGIQGDLSQEERIALLEQIIGDQRELLKAHASPEVGTLPQMFCAYKEVLELYRGGLDIPDDVTIVWPDDNFGYMRDFASEEERGRSGGFGVYYHISYLGRPLAYLWLNTTPPALIWEEMKKAYAHGADRIWILNVGDLKPGEIGIEFFLQMAWDIDRWQSDNLPDFLREWAAREFGTATAAPIAGIMEGYYHLNFQRKPEHLQWWLPREERRLSPLGGREVASRLQAFGQLRAAVREVESELPESMQDAFYQLVAYPVLASAEANARFFALEAHQRAMQAGDGDEARSAAARAWDAHEELQELTRFYNEEMAEGKWKGMMALEPADHQWSSMRIAPVEMPERPAEPALSTEARWGRWQTEKASASAEAGEGRGRRHEADGSISIRAADFEQNQSHKGVRWTPVPGLGRTGEAVTLLPFDAGSFDLGELRGAAPVLEYEVVFEEAGAKQVTVQLLPTHPIEAGGSLRVGVALGDARPAVLSWRAETGGRDWKLGVLDARVEARARIEVPSPGQHTLRLYGIEPGVVVDRLLISPAQP